MSPQRIENNFEGMAPLPQHLRNQGGRRWMSDAFPQTTDAGVIARGPSERDEKGGLEALLGPLAAEAECALAQEWERVSNRWKDDDGRIICRLLEVGDDWEVRRTVREESNGG